MRKLFPLLLLGIAFGVIEASVVIFLRPHFSTTDAPFSLRLLTPETMTALQKTLLSAELWREAATLLLLAGAAAVAARSFFHWASYFVFTFGVWDLFYYIWLSVKIGWPSSLLDWDILFLIPKMWLAPVLAPIIISLIGIVMSVLMVRALEVRGAVRLQFYHWVPVALSLLLWLISFLNKSHAGMTAFPESYSWWLFILGAVICVAAAVNFYREFLLRHRNLMFRTRDR
jgi:hypothetical protein